MDTAHDTITAVAQLLKIPRSSLQSAVNAGTVPAHVLAGGTVVVQVADVRAWMDSPPKRGRPRTVRERSRTPAISRAPDGSLYLATPSEAPERPLTNDSENRPHDTNSSTIATPAGQDNASRG